MKAEQASRPRSSAPMPAGSVGHSCHHGEGFKAPPPKKEGAIPNSRGRDSYQPGTTIEEDPPHLSRWRPRPKGPLRGLGRTGGLYGQRSSRKYSGGPRP